MKRYPGFWTITLIACCLCGVAGVAQAQVAVTVTSTVAVTIGAGDAFSNGGAFTVANTSGSDITISSINFSLTDSAVFASLTLTGQVPGTSAIASSVTSPTDSTTFDFSSLPVLPNGESATFTLSGLASSSPVADSHAVQRFLGHPAGPDGLCGIYVAFGIQPRERIDRASDRPGFGNVVDDRQTAAPPSGPAGAGIDPRRDRSRLRQQHQQQRRIVDTSGGDHQYKHRWHTDWTTGQFGNYHC